MDEKKLIEAREKGKDIAKILAYLKRQGFVFEGEDKGFIKCLLIMNRTPTHTKTV